MTKKIGVLVDFLVPGGVQKTAIEEVKYLKKNGFDVKLLFLSKRYFKKNKSFLENVPFEILEEKYPRFLRINFRLPYFKFLSISHFLNPFLAPVYFKKEGYDLIISHGTTTTFTTLSLFYTRKIPYFVIIYDPMSYILETVYQKTPLLYLFPIIKIFTNFIEKKIIRNAASCFVISKAHTDFIRRNYKVSPIILYLGINPPKVLKSRGSKILFLGRWEKEKNSHQILDIIQKIKDASFAIVGTWTNKNDLKYFKSEIKKRHLSKRINLITRYTKNQLPKILKQSSFWIHPNFEAFSLSALEVASYGLPIILPQNSGVTDLFIDKKHGFFPPKNDQKAFLEAIDYLHQHPKISQEMGAQTARVAKNYTWQRHSKTLALAIKDFFQQRAKK